LISPGERLCRLVADHTHACVEAEARGLGELFAESLHLEASSTADALTCAGLTTGPAGET